MQKALYSLAALALTAGPALAGGDVFATQSTRPITCYAKLIGSGEFVTDRITMPAVTIDSMGQAELGIGGQLGCDYSKELWLAGLFVDGIWNTGSVNVILGSVNALHVPFSNEYSVGGRLGVFSSKATLLYGLVAYTVANEHATMIGLPLGIGSAHGVAIGGGIETALTENLVVSLEYRHVGFDTQTASLLPMKVDTVDNNVRVGLGLRF